MPSDHDPSRSRREILFRDVSKLQLIPGAETCKHHDDENNLQTTPDQQHANRVHRPRLDAERVNEVHGHLDLACAYRRGGGAKQS